MTNEGYSLGDGLEMLPEGTVVKILKDENPFVRVEIVETSRVCLIRRCDLQALCPLKILADQAE